MPRKPNPDRLITITIRLEPETIRRTKALATDERKFNLIGREAWRLGLDLIEQQAQHELFQENA